MKKSLTLGTTMECPYCKEKQYMSSRSRKRMSVYSMIAPPVIIIPSFFDVSTYLLLGIALTVFLAFVLAFPFLVELSSEEKALW